MRRWGAWFLVILFLLPDPLWAAITLDTSTASGGTTSTSHSHTVAADANIAIICVAQREDGLAVAQSTSVTIGAQAATLLSAGVNSTNRVRAEIWYRLSPLTGAQTVAATGGAGTDRMVTGVMTFKNVAQSATFNTPSSLGSSAASTDINLDSIASAVGELVVLCGQTRIQTVTPAPDPTAPVSTEVFEQGFDSGGTTTLGFGYTEAGSTSSVNMRIDLSANELWAVTAASMREDVAAPTRNRCRSVMLP